MKDRGRLSEPQEHALRLERREDDAVGLLTRAFADIGCSRGSADQRWRCVAAPTRAERTHARSRWPVPAPGRARGHRPGSTGLGPAGTRARRAAQAARGSGAIRCGLGSGDRSGCRHSAALPGAPVVSRHVRPSGQSRSSSHGTSIFGTTSPRHRIPRILPGQDGGLDEFLHTPNRAGVLAQRLRRTGPPDHPVAVLFKNGPYGPRNQIGASGRPDSGAKRSRCQGRKAIRRW